MDHFFPEFQEECAVDGRCAIVRKNAVAHNAQPDYRSVLLFLYPIALRRPHRRIQYGMHPFFFGFQVIALQGSGVIADGKSLHYRQVQSVRQHAAVFIFPIISFYAHGVEENRDVILLRHLKNGWNQLVKVFTAELNKSAAGKNNQIGPGKQGGVMAVNVIGNYPDFWGKRPGGNAAQQKSGGVRNDAVPQIVIHNFNQNNTDGFHNPISFAENVGQNPLQKKGFHRKKC